MLKECRFVRENGCVPGFALRTAANVGLSGGGAGGGHDQNPSDERISILVSEVRKPLVVVG